MKTLWIRGLDGYLCLIAAEWVDRTMIKELFSISEGKTQELYDTLSDDFSDLETQEGIFGCIRYFDAENDKTIFETGLDEKITLHSVSTMLESMGRRNVQ
jgi:hypothetical protein